MKRRMRQYFGILAAVVIYYVVHEGAHLICALWYGVFKQVNFMGVGIQIDVYNTRMTDLQMGVLYGNDYDYQRALESMQEALCYYELAGKERLQHIAKRDMGLTYLNMLQYLQADSLLNEVLAWSEAHNNFHIMNSVLTPLLRLYDATANVESLERKLPSRRFIL